ncbi:hypothetical protein BT69DRAFT_1284894 [Atractiella rhizophila]|nr:hypothetical protein BT69DRAFT_1284894 [Atractiella rhizophila]
MTGLLPPCERFRQLGAGLTAHLRSLSRFNPALPLVISPWTAPPLTFCIVPHIQSSMATFSPFKPSFVANGFASSASSLVA